MSFTKKSVGQIVAVWLSDASDDVAQSVLHEVIPQSPNAQQFKVKLLRHKEMASKDYKIREKGHRRVKSCPVDLMDDGGVVDEEERQDLLPPPSPMRSNEGEVKSLLARRAQTGVGKGEHARSHSDSQRDESFMMAPLGFQQGDSSNSSSGQFPPPTIPAPTPIKDWAQGWSPSQFLAAQQQRGFPPSTQQPKDVDSTTSPPSHQPTGSAPVKSPQSKPNKSDAQSPGQVQSTRKPFVCRGKAYPPGLNRKDQRAILFENGNPPKVDSYDVGTDVPDGEIEVAQFEAFKKAAEQKQTTATETL
jgi:hypothetical protein